MTNELRPILTEIIPPDDGVTGAAVARSTLRLADPDDYGFRFKSPWPTNPEILNPPPPIDCAILDAGMGR